MFAEEDLVFREELRESPSARERRSTSSSATTSPPSRRLLCPPPAGRSPSPARRLTLRTAATADAVAPATGRPGCRPPHHTSASALNHEEAGHERDRPSAALGAVIALPTANAVAAIEKSASVAATPKKIVVSTRTVRPAVEVIAARGDGHGQGGEYASSSTASKATRRWSTSAGMFMYDTYLILYTCSRRCHSSASRHLALDSVNVDMIGGYLHQRGKQRGRPRKGEQAHR